MAGTVERDEGISGIVSFKTQVSESRALLVKAHNELQLKNEQIQLLANENAELLSRFKTEKETRQRLQADLKSGALEKTSRITQDIDSKLKTKHPQYATPLGDLTKEGRHEMRDDSLIPCPIIYVRVTVKRARDELQDMYFENSRYRSEVQKLTSALERMDEQNGLERKEWKSKAIQLLQKLQTEGEEFCRRCRPSIYC